MSARSAPADAPTSVELGPLKATTIVDQVVEAIVARALLGRFQPGGRINELALARELAVSRAPIREALRMLVALDVVENTPYQGMRLSPLPKERVQEISKVRLELEKLALREILTQSRRENLVDALQDVIEDMKFEARKQDRVRLAQLDADFHESIMRVSGNRVLLKLWQMLRPQLTIMFGLSQYGVPGAETPKTLRKIVEEHHALLEGLRAGKYLYIAKMLEAHILEDDLSIALLGGSALPRRRRRSEASVRV